MLFFWVFKLAIRLIQADLKHHQLISALESIHLETGGLYYVNLVDVVATVMGMEKRKSDLWLSTYHSYMEQAHAHTIEERGDNLMPLAQDCYQHLLACCQIEQKIAETKQAD